MAEPDGERIARVEQSLKAVHDDVHELWGAVNGVRLDVTGIRNDMATAFREAQDERHKIREAMLGRPSWPVSILITVLSSLVVGLAVALANVST